MAKPLTYAPSVYVAAARTRVTSNKLLGLPSSPKLLRLASGDTTVLDERDQDESELDASDQKT